jgi:hypothetical protein
MLIVSQKNTKNGEENSLIYFMVLEDPYLTLAKKQNIYDFTELLLTPKM